MAFQTKSPVDTELKRPYGSAPTLRRERGIARLGDGISIGKEVCNQMSVVTALINFFNRDKEDGQGLAEYALILALIAIVAIIALIFLGGQVSKILSTVGSSI